ncbi:MAG: trypsin-like peptidase domain-containing protein [Thermomicrobiales bacterium]|nr:trypsin-like peptidase domain-containing protein [Thermomicrobiales bacterium]
MENIHDRSTRPARTPWSPKRLVAAGILTFGLAFGAGSAGTISTLIQPNPVAAQDLAAAQQQSVADVYAAANPAVVTITTFVDASTLQQAQGQQIPGMPNQQLPGQDQLPPAENGAAGSNLVEYASGSGFIVDDAGHVVTNNHVVAGAVAFQVRYSDGTVETASLVGADPFQDVAVLKIDLAEGASVPGTVAWGDSSTMRPGDEVVAIGTPYGEFNNTVSDGMIGALDGDLNSGGGYSLPNLIQHNAAIYPGNSGGPLLNMAGQVVGINVAKAYGDVNSTVDEGFNFAIESNVAQAIVDEIIATGHYARPYLGIQAQATMQGVAVMEVETNGPAAMGGLQAGDVITGIAGDASIDPSEALDTILFEKKPGDTVTLEVVRNGQNTTVDVTLGERPTALPQ